MNLRSNLILLLAFVVGTGLAIATRIALTSPPEKDNISTADGALVPVLVAKRTLAVGEEITPQNIRFKLCPEDEVPKPAIFHFKDAVGRTLIKTVEEGLLVSLYDLGKPSENTQKNTYISPGCQLVSFAIKSIQGDGVLGNPFHLKKVIHPNKDAASFTVFYEDVGSENKSQDNFQRKLMTRHLLDNIDIYDVKICQKMVNNAGMQKDILILTFILDKQQLETIKEAANQGQINISIYEKDKNESHEVISSWPVQENSTEDKSSPESAESLSEPVDAQDQNPSDLLEGEGLVSFSAEPSNPMENNEKRAEKEDGATIEQSAEDEQTISLINKNEISSENVSKNSLISRPEMSEELRGSFTTQPQNGNEVIKTDDQNEIGKSSSPTSFSVTAQNSSVPSEGSLRSYDKTNVPGKPQIANDEFKMGEMKKSAKRRTASSSNIKGIRVSVPRPVSEDVSKSSYKSSMSMTYSQAESPRMSIPRAVLAQEKTNLTRETGAQSVSKPRLSAPTPTPSSENEEWASAVSREESEETNEIAFAVSSDFTYASASQPISTISNTSPSSVPTVSKMSSNDSNGERGKNQVFRTPKTQVP